MGRANFENELKQLHLRMIEMGNLVEISIEESITAFVEKDVERCKAIIENDANVNDAEKKIESQCLWLIAREQPIASDLRKITAALKITTDMERIGDHAADIAKLTLGIIERNSLTDSIRIPQMAAAAIEMVHNAVTAYVNDDLDLAKRTKASDDTVDDYFDLIKQELIDVFKSQPQHINDAIDLLLIAKYLERIADHAVNICRWVRFSLTGKYKKMQIF